MQALACFNLQERLMPYLRGESARRLAKEGLRQSRIAEHLGVSQAMVSKYLRASRQMPPGVPPAFLQAVIRKGVTGVMEQESQGRTPAWCPLCPEVSGLAKAEGPGSVHLEECLRSDATPSRDESHLVLENLKEAARRLRRPGASRLAPEVFINIAMSLPEARDSRGVAAFPGRLVEMRGEVRAVADPEFGASGHLSDLLLRIRRSHPDKRAIMCVRDDEAVRAAMRRAGLQSVVVPRKGKDIHVRLSAKRAPDALIDPGAFGIEPIVYILGQTALDAVAKAETILRSLRDTGGR